MKISNSRLWRNMAIFGATIGLIIAIFGFTLNCEASNITWHQLNEATVAWDAVTTLTNGDPIPAGDIVEYRVYVAEPGKKDEKVKLGETELLEFQVGAPGEGQWFAGVQAVRYRLIGEDVKELGVSVIAWSDIPEFTDNNPFGIEFYFKPETTFNIRKEEGS